MLFGGIEGVFLGASAKLLTKGDRAVSIGIGAITIGLSVAALAYPMLATLTVVLLISIGLFILGVGNLTRGLSRSRMSGLSRIMFIAAGAITIALSVGVMIFPMVGIGVLSAYIALALIISGSSYVGAGITGAMLRPVYGSHRSDTALA